MHCVLPALGAALALVQAVVSEPTPSAQDVPAPRRLHPIHVRNYEASFGLRRRSTEQFSSLDLQSQSQLIYGSPLENEQLLLANMTLFAPDGLQMILLEEFDGLTTSVDCKGDDGMMSLTFKSQDAFNYALKTWNFINEKEESKFLVIANHVGCGPDDQRQPYYITRISEDAATFTTHLTSQIAPWSEVAGTYDMDFGKAIPYQRPSQLQTRGLWDDIKGAIKGAANDVKNGVNSVVNDVKGVATDVENGVKGVVSDIGNVITGNIDVSKSVSFGMNAGTPNKKTQLFTDNTHLTLSCINCYITGSVEVTGHISVHHFKLQDLTMDGKPHGLNGAVEFEAQVTKYEKPDSWKFTKDLFSAPVPDAGIEVPGIFKIGAILSYQVGVQAQLQGSATIDFGLGLNVPDTAGIHADVLHPSSSTAQGLSGDIKPLFDIKALSATLQFAAFAQPKLSFGVELTEIGTLDIALVFKMPQIAVKFIAAYNESGLCTHEPGASKTGVQILTQVGLELDLQIDASLGPASTMKPSYWMKLWQDYHQLSLNCWPIAIPGLSVPSNSLTTQPALPSATSSAATSSAANFSLLTGTEYSAYTAPTYLPSGVRSAVPLSGNASGVVVPTGFLKSSGTGAAHSTGVFSTNGRASGTSYPHPSSNASSILASGSGSTRLPSGSGSRTISSGAGSAASGIYPPMPTGSHPLPPSGSAASSGRIPPKHTGSHPHSSSGSATASGRMPPKHTGSHPHSSSGTAASSGRMPPKHTGSRPHSSSGSAASSGRIPPTHTGSRPQSASGSAAASGIYPPMPTGTPPLPPSGSAASSGRIPPMPTELPPLPPSEGAASSGSVSSSVPVVNRHSTEYLSEISSTKSSTHAAHTKSTKTEAPYPTDTENARKSSSGAAHATGSASASLYRFRY